MVNSAPIRDQPRASPPAVPGLRFSLHPGYSPPSLSGNLAAELQPHAVIGRLDVSRQLGAQFCVVEIAVHVGEDRALRPDAVDPLQRQVEVKMARMRSVPERVDDPQLDAGERLYGS